MVHATRTVVDGIAFPEGLRWRDGSLWYSDILRDVVSRVVPGTAPEPVCSSVTGPSGLAFVGDHLYVVSLLDHGLYDATGDGRLVVDLDAAGAVGPNDAVAAGDALYVGYFGREYAMGDELGTYGDGEGPGGIALVEPGSGDVRIVATGLASPNGMVVTAGGARLVVAETYRHRLVVFDRGPDGSLSGRRTLAEFAEGIPDGLAVDAQDGVWAGLPNRGEFVRVAGGEIADRVSVPDWSTVACALGGPDGRTLFMAVCQMDGMAAFFRKEARGRILATDVDVPAAL